MLSQVLELGSWPLAVKHSICEGNGEGGVVFNSKNLLACDEGREKENLIHRGKHSQERSLD